MRSSSFLEIELALRIPVGASSWTELRGDLTVGRLTMLHGVTGTLLPRGGEKHVIRSEQVKGRTR
jgi:hypothetical protein